MIRIVNKILPAILVVCFFITIAVSCKKDKDQDKKTDKIELLSFGPTGVKHGEEIRFFGTNLDKVTSIEFTGTNAVINKAAFSKQTWDLITLVVPQAAERGRVTLKTSQGDIVSKAMFDLGVGPTVTTITEEARPGATITIKGTYLNWVTTVTFAKGKIVEAFVKQTFDELVVTVPADAETGPLVIGYSGTDAGDFETDLEVIVTLPHATAITPVASKHSDNITLTGTNLDLVKKVYFTNVAVAVEEFVSQSATQLVVKVPGSTKKGKIKLQAASGVQTESATELDIILPAITSFAPNPVDPEADLTITGTNLDLVTAVRLENVPAITTFESQSATQLVVKVPVGTGNGLISLGVLNSTIEVVSDDILKITGTAPPPAISLHIYDDAVVNWNGWVGNGWGGNINWDNASPVRVGTKSIRIESVNDNYGAPFQLGAGNIDVTPYTSFKFSVYGAPGSAGKKVTISFSGVDGNYVFEIVEGEWTDYSVPLSTLTSGTSLTELLFKAWGNTNFTFYVDEIGFF